MLDPRDDRRVRRRCRRREFGELLERREQDGATDLFVSIQHAGCVVNDILICIRTLSYAGKRFQVSEDGATFRKDQPRHNGDAGDDSDKERR